MTHDTQPGVVRPDILRAEALKALAEINTSQSLRRALLRKTSTAHQHDLLPGQNCAYWRWQNPKGRSTKKRGAWVVARFLSYDPDGRSAWLHSGTTTLQVALEQIRSAYGFENWQPSKDDIKVLRDAAANLRQDLWQDHKASAPPIDEDAYDYQLDELPQPSTTYQRLKNLGLIRQQLHVLVHWCVNAILPDLVHVAHPKLSMVGGHVKLNGIKSNVSVDHAKWHMYVELGELHKTFS